MEAQERGPCAGRGATSQARMFSEPPPPQLKTHNLVSSFCVESHYYPRRRAQAHWDEQKWLHNNDVE